MRYLMEVLAVVLTLYMVLLFGRVIFSWITHYAREWRPHGLSLLLHEACYSATDRPVRALRSVLPQINLGGIRFDLSVPVLILLCSAALNLVLILRNR